jgi:branched-chain amino acid transport system ATP-binding protein
MPLLELEDVYAGYGPSRVLQGVSLSAEPGEVVGIFGRNGAGKTTTLNTIMGWLAPSSGSIRFAGQEIGGLRPDRIFRLGIGFIPEDRRIFSTLTVQENLMLGLFSQRLSQAAAKERLQRVFRLFPRLEERRLQLGKTLSGGEQQMLAIARALVGDPKLLLVDEPSEGLAPVIVEEIFAALARMRAEGIALLLVEQNVRRAAAVADTCCVMEKGRVVARGEPAIALADEEVRKRLSV